MLITPTFTSNFNVNFGANAPAAQAAWIAAAAVFTSNFTDNIHINIIVDAVTDPQAFGSSESAQVFPLTYANLRTLLVADATTANDNIALGPGGSLPVADPTNGAGTFFVTRAQAKALRVIADDQANDGTTTFGSANPFTFSGPIAPETFDFQGVAAHEISEVLGRIGFKNTPANSFSLLDLFSFTGPGKRDLVGGPNNNFSIDNGTTLLKLFNDPTSPGLGQGLDSRDWAVDPATGEPGTPDSFNQISAPSVVNPVSAVDLQLLDVIGYDLVQLAAAATRARAFPVLRGIARARKM
jgi:hypothetical protein